MYDKYIFILDHWIFIYSFLKCFTMPNRAPSPNIKKKVFNWRVRDDAMGYTLVMDGRGIIFPKSIGKYLDS